MSGDERGVDELSAAGSFSAFIGRLEAEVGMALMAVGALGLLVATMWLIPSMYYYDTPALEPAMRLAASVGLVVAVVAEFVSLPWLGKRMALAPHPQPVSIAAGTRIRWWPARLVLACWWLAQAGGVFWVAEHVLRNYADFHPISTAGQVFGGATRLFILFFASYLSTVYVLIGLGFLGAGRVWLMRIYRARVLLDLGIAAAGLAATQAAR